MPTAELVQEEAIHVQLRDLVLDIAGQGAFRLFGALDRPFHVQRVEIQDGDTKGQYVVKVFQWVTITHSDRHYTTCSGDPAVFIWDSITASLFCPWPAPANAPEGQS